MKRVHAGSGHVTRKVIWQLCTASLAVMPLPLVCVQLLNIHKDLGISLCSSFLLQCTALCNTYTVTRSSDSANVMNIISLNAQCLFVQLHSLSHCSDGAVIEYCDSYGRCTRH